MVWMQGRRFGAGKSRSGGWIVAALAVSITNVVELTPWFASLLVVVVAYGLGVPRQQTTGAAP